MTPTVYGPEFAPPGVEIRWLSRPDATGKPLWRTRPHMSPRLILLHTNGASNPGSIDSSFNWANQYNSNTKPHYQVQRDGSAAKFLPSNRVGIGNYRAAPFSLCIETQDLGYGVDRPGESCGYTVEQADTIARIIAFEHISHGGRIPLVVPTAWDGSGIGSHTDPFGYDQWTNARGKVCPGAAKKAQLRPLIIPWATQYVAEWTAPPPPPIEPPEVDMIILDWGITTMLWTGTELAWVENGNVNPVIERAKLKRLVVSDDELHGVILCSQTTTRAPHTLTPQLKGAWESRAER